MARWIDHFSSGGRWCFPPRPAQSWQAPVLVPSATWHWQQQDGALGGGDQSHRSGADTRPRPVGGWQKSSEGCCEDHLVHEPCVMQSRAVSGSSTNQRDCPLCASCACLILIGQAQFFHTGVSRHCVRQPTNFSPRARSNKPSGPSASQPRNFLLALLGLIFGWICHAHFFPQIWFPF